MKRMKMFLVLLCIQLACIETAYSQSEILGSPNAIVYGIKIIPEKKLIVANLGDSIQLWNYKTKSLINSWAASKIVAIDYNKNELVGVSKSGDVILWDISTGKKIFQQAVAASPIICVAWIDSVSIAVGTDNGELLKVNRLSGEVTARIKNSTAITAIVLGHDRNTLITGDAKGMLSIYNVKDLQLQVSTKAHKGWIREIVTSDYNESFITSSDDGYYKKWKAGEQINLELKHHSMGWILCSDFFDDRDGRSDLIAFGKMNGKLIVRMDVGFYSMHMNSIINSVCLIQETLPSITLAVGTHGSGLQLVSGKGMKLTLR